MPVADSSSLIKSSLSVAPQLGLLKVGPDYVTLQWVIKLMKGFSIQ
jgi:hypothetical protein